MLGLRLFQHSNGRYSDVSAYSQYDDSHPDHLEGTSQCQVEECVHCLGLQKCREFVNSCYTSQHQENDPEAIQGNFILTMLWELQLKVKNILVLLYSGRKMVDYIVKHKLFSILFLPRQKLQKGTRRGVPAPAALAWALMEETRWYLELQFNDNVRISARPLRESLEAMFGKF